MVEQGATQPGDPFEPTEPARARFTGSPRPGDDGDGDSDSDLRPLLNRPGDPDAPSPGPAISQHDQAHPDGAASPLGTASPGRPGVGEAAGGAQAPAVPAPRSRSTPRGWPARGAPRDPLRLPRRVTGRTGAGPTLLEAPRVPPSLRECAGCARPVAQPEGSGAAALEGACGECGHRYSFTVKLRPGERVGRYTVHGVIAHGGLGWVYAATDDNLGGDGVQAWVVLKGLLDAANPEARRVAEGERRILTTVSHPSIVKILDYVAHAGEDYIVMEYVPGISLAAMADAAHAEQARAEQARAGLGGQPGAYPGTGAAGRPVVADVLRYLLRVLPALGHLHRMGLVYCDFKPDNVMITASGVKLIDLGGARRLDDRVSGYLSTPGYRAPELDDDGERPAGIVRCAPTITTDVFAVARTLARLVLGRFAGFVDAYRHTMPPRRAHQPLRQFESLDRLLRRATATDPDRRFQSVTELADELVGVLYEIVARTEGPVPPLASRWFDAAGHPTGEAGPGLAPAAFEVLPDLRVDPDDPHAPALAAGPDEEPAAHAARLAAIVPVTTEVRLCLARATIRAGALAQTARVLDEAARVAPLEWRVDWYRGVAALVGGQPDRAVAAFDLVFSQVPGELAPRLALAMAQDQVAERAAALDGPEPIGRDALTPRATGDPRTAGASQADAARLRAADLFDIVSAIDPGVTSAAFGLARCRTDPQGRLDAYLRVPRSSFAYTASRVRMIEVLVAQAAADDTPGAGQAALTRAATMLTDPLLDLGERRRAELCRDLYLGALDLLAAGLIGGDDGGRGPGGGRPDPPLLLGGPMTERELRFGLERTYREMARLTSDRAGRVRLVDQANRARPRTLR
ncbi:serine/threonine-protein kinase [Candidatus Frankia nodulisporulans]|uniref:serine/threonine-protein kinase n=1 Tax=Candidatus Frankia nodulisporulans TaxID=2060052 RepID=UPI001CDCDD9D|nr:serine/threonine-protein kinase [Candidatus Frankia nodulisporulans]